MLVTQYYFGILTDLLINTYFNETYCLMIFTDTDNHFRYSGSIPMVQLNFPDNILEEKLIFKRYGCKGIVIQTDRPSETLVQFEKLIKLNSERFNSRRFLILPSKNVSGVMEDPKIIFSSKQLDYITDFLVLNVANVEEFELLTHKYIGLENNNEIILLDKWFVRNQSFLYVNNLYPDKITNQQGRKIKVATFTYKPYSIAGTSINNSDGTEMRYAIELVRKYNMTAQLIVNLVDEWGDVYDNWTGTGLLGNLIKDVADIGFAALYTWEYEYHFLDLSKPLVRTGITCLVPAPRLAAGWLSPLFSFSSPLWIGVGLSFVFSIISLFLLAYLKQTSSAVKMLNREKHRGNTELEDNLWNLFEESTLQITAIFLLQSISTKRELAKDRVTKYLMACIILLSLLLATSYSSGLASSMTIPRYENSIRTVQDLIDSGLNWGATSNAWITSIESSEYKKYVILVERFTPRSGEILQSYVPTGKYGFSIERLPYGHYAIGTYIQKDSNLIPMIEDLYWEYSVFMMRKNSILLPAVDLLVLRISEAGLPDHWESQVSDKYMDIELQQAVKYLSHHADANSGPVKLKWIHVEGAFGVLAIGMAISLACFLLEIMTFRIKVKPILFTA